MPFFVYIVENAGIIILETNNTERFEHMKHYTEVNTWKALSLDHGKDLVIDLLAGWIGIALEDGDTDRARFYAKEIRDNVLK